MRPNPPGPKLTCTIQVTLILNQKPSLIALIEIRQYLTKDVITGVTTSEGGQHRSDISEVLHKAGSWLDVPLVLNVGVFAGHPAKL